MAKPKAKAKPADVVHSAPPPSTAPVDCSAFDLGAPAAAPEPPNVITALDPETLEAQRIINAATSAGIETIVVPDGEAAETDEPKPLVLINEDHDEREDEPRHDITDREVFAVIRRCEKQALGHGADLDRALLLECAQWFRTFMGVGLSDPLPDIPTPTYAPTVNAPAIGHSLPTDSQR